MTYSQRQMYQSTPRAPIPPTPPPPRARPPTFEFMQKNCQIPSYVDELHNQMSHCQGTEKLSNSPPPGHAIRVLKYIL